MQLSPIRFLYGLMLVSLMFACGPGSGDQTGAPASDDRASAEGSAGSAAGAPGAQGASAEGNEGKKPPEFQGKRVAVIHTANLIGELEPCG